MLLLNKTTILLNVFYLKSTFANAVAQQHSGYRAHMLDEKGDLKWKKRKIICILSSMSICRYKALGIIVT